MADIKSFYKGRRVLVTGHTGFKGSWLCRMLLDAGADVTGYGLEPPARPNLYELAGLDGQLHSVLGDIRDLELLRAAFQQARPEIVFHLAAQPIVREGYRDPVGTYSTNVMGTVHVLECVRHTQSVRSVVNVTTDKVYQNQEWIWSYRENGVLDGYDPYSNSKSCSELVSGCYARSFLHTAGIPLSTMRAGNVIGGGDFAPDRIVPDCVRCTLAGQPITVRNPYSTRPYQHVLEALEAYLLVAKEQYRDPALAGSYNVGPNDGDCVTTGRLAELFCEAWGPEASWTYREEKDAPHEAKLLQLDSTKIKAVFGWAPRWDVGMAVRKTVEWAKLWQQGGDVRGLMSKQITELMGQ